MLAPEQEIAMNESVHKVEGVGAGVTRIFELAGMTTVLQLAQISTREENQRLLHAANQYVRERFPGLSDEYYRIHTRRMVTRSVNVAIRIQEGQRVHMEIPEPFQCPLSYEWLLEPVITPDGNTYSRAEIQRWVETSATDPLTREPLTVDQLIPNRAMADAIEFYRRQTARISIMC